MIQIIRAVLATAAIVSVLIVYACCVVAGRTDKAAQQMKTKVFKARIRDSVAVREAQALQTDLFKYAPLSTSAQDYKAFVKELLAGWQTKRR